MPCWKGRRGPSRPLTLWHTAVQRQQCMPCSSAVAAVSTLQQCLPGVPCSRAYLVYPAAGWQASQAPVASRRHVALKTHVLRVAHSHSSYSLLSALATTHRAPRTHKQASVAFSPPRTHSPTPSLPSALTQTLPHSPPPHALTSSIRLHRLTCSSVTRSVSNMVRPITCAAAS